MIVPPRSGVGISRVRLRCSLWDQKKKRTSHQHPYSAHLLGIGVWISSCPSFIQLCSRSPSLDCFDFPLPTGRVLFHPPRNARACASQASLRHVLLPESSGWGRSLQSLKSPPSTPWSGRKGSRKEETPQNNNPKEYENGTE